MELGLSRTRSAALVAITGALLAVSIRGLMARTGDPGDRFTLGLLWGASWLLVFACAWLCTMSLALLLEAISGRRPPALGWCGAPPALRRMVTLSSGAALCIGLAAPALANTSAPPADLPSTLDGLHLPVRPLSVGPAATSTHHVAPGDSLWRIAQHLAPDAATSEVARMVAQLHHHNRVLIGEDPDVLVPGQRLEIPAALR